MLKRHRVAYSTKKKQEYEQVIHNSLQKVKQPTLKQFIYDRASEELIKTIRNMPECSALSLTFSPPSFIKHLLINITEKVQITLKIKFKNIINELWSDVYDVGRKHIVQDILFATDLFTKQFGQVKTLSNFDGLTLTDIVEFADEDNPADSKTNSKLIARGRRNLTILRNNVNRLKDEGVLYDSFDLSKSVPKSARLTIEQRIKFLESVQEINDINKKADASRQQFLGDEYLKRRFRVLTDQYVGITDNYIKEQLGIYLDKNIEGIRQIQNKQNDAHLLAQKISKELQNTNVKTLKEPEKQAEVILRTELSIAYNFGKLAGFTSPVDLGRKFKWNADWELQGKHGYEICPACKAMDGRIYTVHDLLAVGTRVDRGILKYEGKTRTDFKNPGLPMIPFHPNCSCYWTVEPDDREKERDDIYVGEPIPTAKTNEIPGTAAQMDTVANTTIPALLGTGLLVGGLFLLARSNVWRAFYRTSQIAAETIVTQPKPLQIVDDIIDTQQFIKKTFDNSAVQQYNNVLANTLADLPKNLVSVSR